MKKFFLLLLSAVAIAAGAQTQNGYKLDGTADGVENGDTVYLCNMQGYFSLVPLDTTVITQGNRFTFTGRLNGADDRFIVPMHKGKAVATAEIVLEDCPMVVHVYADANKHPDVKGGTTNALLQQYDSANVYNREIQAPWAIVQDSTATAEARQKAQQQVDSLQQLSDKFTKQFIYDHIPSAFSDLMFYYSQSLYTDAEKKAVLDKMGAGPHYQFYNLMDNELKARQATAVGQKYTDIALKGTKGEVVRVSDYVTRNKYTLIDFWASWCGPCRAEMPNVVKAYSLYHKKGFEVVGVSLDNNRQAWLKAIAALKMPWPQMSDLKGWQSAGAAAYNVKAIPSNALIDANGNIIAKDLRGDDLQNKLAELFK